MTTDTTTRQKILLVGFGLSVVAVGLIVVELVLRLGGVGGEYRYEDPFVGFAAGKNLFVLDESGDRYITRAEKIEYFNPQTFARNKPADQVRIFAVGGSTTVGRPYDHEVAFCRWLELFLQSGSESANYRCINAGGISYASYRVTVLLEELLDYEPDVVIVYTGHNEFLEERSYGEFEKGHRVVRVLDSLLSPLRVYSSARHLLREARRASEDESRGVVPAEVTTRLDGWTGIEQFARDEQLESKVYDHFEFNLEQMIRMARDRGVEIVFVEPVSNLKDFSPFKSEFASRTSSEDRLRIRSLIREIGARRDRGDFEAAVQAARGAVDLDPLFADSHFELGQLLFEGGEFESAGVALEEARDLDVAPLRARNRIVELVREVTERNEVPAVGLVGLLEDLSIDREGHSILGNELLLDHVHPTIEVHALIATELVGLLSELGLVPSPTDRDRIRWQEIVQSHSVSLDAEYYAERDLNLAKVLGWSGKLAEAEAPLQRAVSVLDDHPQVHLNLGIIYQQSGRLRAAEESLRRALELAPQMPEVSFNLGVALGRVGKTQEGIEALERAIELRDGYLEAFYNVGILRRETSDFSGSVAAFERALERAPTNPEVLAGLGRSLLLAGREDEAIEILARATGSSAEQPLALLDLALARAARGEVEAALDELESIAEQHPQMAVAHFETARLLATTGRLPEALGAYRRALEIEPSNARASNNLGILLARTGDLPGARLALETAIELAPQFADAHFNLGVVLDQSGTSEAAREAISTAIELDPENPRYHQALGLLFLAGGDRVRAIRHLQVAERGGLALSAELKANLGMN